MHINQCYEELPLLEPASHRYIGRDGACRKESEPVLKEHMIEVYINETLTMKLVCTPQFLAELVLGRLLTEGMIRTGNDVEQISICASGARAEVLLKKKSRRISQENNYIETTPSSCTANHVLNNDFQEPQPVRPVVPIPWRAAHIFSLADRFADGMPLHRKTCATHSCFLARKDELLFECEDIGRHNALDKTIGHALRQDIPLSECIIYSSGRVPTDMAMKAIRAGIPILASKASPTWETIALAEKYNLTLICAARRDRMKLFTGMPPSDESKKD